MKNQAFVVGPVFIALAVLYGCSETTTEALGQEDAGEATADADASFSEDVVSVGTDTGLPDLGTPDVDITALCADLAPTGNEWVPSVGDFVLRDVETGSLWNARGEAFDGPCTGARLEQLPSFTTFWFAWSASRNGGSVWTHEGIVVNETSDYSPDASGDCSVPCSEIRSGGPAPDGIPALDHAGRWERPQAQQMVPAGAATYLEDSDLILGVVVDGQARAYPHNIFWWHEIQIDEIGGMEFNVTYCPLTGSGMVFPVDQGGEAPLHLYVSGRLFNSNLTMFERDPVSGEPTFWNQMMLEAISGPRAGETLELMPVTETTWGRWVEMYPETLVTSDDTGYDRNYARYPYGDYITNHGNTFGAINPQYAETYPEKTMALAVELAGESRAYSFSELRGVGDRVVINDRIGDVATVVYFDAAHAMAVPFDRLVDGVPLTFEGATVE